MNDEQNLYQTDAPDLIDHDQPRIFERPAGREALLSALHKHSDAQLRPASPPGTPGHGRAQASIDNDHRQTMAEHESAELQNEEIRATKPDEQPRPNVAKADVQQRPAMPEQVNGSEHEETRTWSTDKNDSAERKATGSRPDMPNDGKASSPDAISEKQGTAKTEREAPPESADLVTVEEAVRLFAQAGLPRHIRTIQKYCAKKKGRALVSYQIPTENGIRYMIERSSIDRFIRDATHQAPTGRLEEEVPVPSPSNNGEAPAAQTSSGTTADLAVYDHPYVKRLEEEIDKEKERYASLQMRFETAMDVSNQRLVELQQASAVAQSESLGRFLIETKRMEIEPEHTTAPVHNPPAKEESVVQ